MEAATLQKKKFNKTKLKKTIKNVLCRPDPEFWPALSDSENESLICVLNKLKVHIPEFKKPHWNELKTIPKDKRPKPPKIERIDGLIFGISECLAAINNGEISSIIVESSVNPRNIIQPILEACLNKEVPVVSLKGLRNTCASNFGIPTSCLGVKSNLDELNEKVKELSKNKVPKASLKRARIEDEMSSTKPEIPMEIQTTAPCPYLYRTDKTSRVFIPPNVDFKKEKLKFIGQDFIEFSNKNSAPDKKAYMKMIVKKISNNPNRTKVK